MVADTVSVRHVLCHIIKGQKNPQLTDMFILETFRKLCLSSLVHNTGIAKTDLEFIWVHWQIIFEEDNSTFLQACMNNVAVCNGHTLVRDAHCAQGNVYPAVHAANCSEQTAHCTLNICQFYCTMQYALCTSKLTKNPYGQVTVCPWLKV